LLLPKAHSCRVTRILLHSACHRRPCKTQLFCEDRMVLNWTMTFAKFPGDPRSSAWTAIGDADVRAIAGNEWLSTDLLDSILQRTVPPEYGETSTSAFYLGSLGTLVYMQSCNDKVKAIMNNPLHDELPEAGASRRKIDRVRVAMKSCFTSRPVSRLIIPIVLGSHFFVLCMDCSFSTPEFIENVKLYDSLKRCTRQVSSWCSWHC